MSTSQIHAVSHDRCRAPLASVPPGRGAFVRDGQPVVRPVDFTVADGQRITLRPDADDASESGRP